VVTPIFQSANYEMAGETDYHGIRYMRLGNSPNHVSLREKLAAIEGAEAAVVAGSGMAAITATLLSLLGSGDHLLAQKTLYGGTATFLTHEAPRWGIAHTPVDVALPETWAPALRPETRVFYLESVSNPLLEVGDLEAVVGFAREHGLVTVIDNTFLSPVNFRPLEHGFDLVVHSATKYLNGHSDIVAGVVAGEGGRVRRIVRALNHLGGSLDAHACFLLDRGLKTLALRVRRQNQGAMRVAGFLARHASVADVRYPGLPNDPSHRFACPLFDGFGGMVSFYARDAAAAERFLGRVTLPLVAASLGGVESLVVLPARSSHLGMAAEEREALGITDALVRISVGLEDVDELIEDFDQAL
jgi:cystathionine beta-lyase/cystathionine gamma-synthase